MPTKPIPWRASTQPNPRLALAALGSSELYDPEVGLWYPAADLNKPRVFHRAVMLQDGRVLVAGGEDASGEAIASSELYDPATDEWTSVGDLNQARTLHTATLLPNLSDFFASAEIFDPDSLTWKLTGEMGSGRYRHQELTIPLGFDYRDETFCSYTFPDGLPEGDYGLFLALIPPGALDDGRLDAGDLLELAVQNFSYHH